MGTKPPKLSKYRVYHNGQIGKPYQYIDEDVLYYVICAMIAIIIFI